MIYKRLSYRAFSRIGSLSAFVGITLTMSVSAFAAPKGKVIASGSTWNLTDLAFGQNPYNEGTQSANLTASIATISGTNVWKSNVLNWFSLTSGNQSVLMVDPTVRYAANRVYNVWGSEFRHGITTTGNTLQTTNTFKSADLVGKQSVFLTSSSLLSQAETKALADFVQNGGNVYLTGVTAGFVQSSNDASLASDATATFSSPIISPIQFLQSARTRWNNFLDPFGLEFTASSLRGSNVNRAIEALTNSPVGYNGGTYWNGGWGVRGKGNPVALGIEGKGVVGIYTPVPEPAFYQMSAFLLGGSLLLLRRKRKV